MPAVNRPEVMGADATSDGASPVERQRTAGIEAVWTRLEALTERADAAVKDLASAIVDRRVVRVAGAVQVLVGMANESLRLLGRLDAEREREIEGEDPA